MIYSPSKLTLSFISIFTDEFLSGSEGAFVGSVTVPAGLGVAAGSGAAGAVGSCQNGANHGQAHNQKQQEANQSSHHNKHLHPLFIVNK